MREKFRFKRIISWKSRLVEIRSFINVIIKTPDSSSTDNILRRDPTVMSRLKGAHNFLLTIYHYPQEFLTSISVLNLLELAFTQDLKSLIEVAYL